MAALSTWVDSVDPLLVVAIVAASLLILTAFVIARMARGGAR